jgi:prepilin-type N-terminal cleavage/methylation domain-containing protein
MKLKTQNNKGFSLIEMIVAVGIFAVVMTISLAALLNLSDIQKKAEALRATNDNLNFSLETMMREIRSGKSYCAAGLGPVCSSDRFVFVNGSNVIVYRLNNARIEKSADGGANYITMTAPEIRITKLLFWVQGQAANDKIQPRVTIIINGSAGDKKVVNLNLQTTISQRQLDS